ncbi:hypothetical protein [Actinoallomurus iriomotensis]|uniref:Uncharacterized protein n=1 Tax=Actinoallomurus iriomotensis TaxID=478107 RepID=A0A9W6S1C3_9ACTN|nr:hypothetical protein [Actinoallomurus iriomotensis]GLY86696.1 hypothetical protein Airi02_046250 [Actinoallomurus iriomotensis]
MPPSLIAPYGCGRRGPGKSITVQRITGPPEPAGYAPSGMVFDEAFSPDGKTLAAVPDASDVAL